MLVDWDEFVRRNQKDQNGKHCTMSSSENGTTVSILNWILMHSSLHRHASRCVWRVADWTTLQCRLNDCNISQLTANQIIYIYRERAVVIYETQDVGDFINLTRCAMRIERKTYQVTFLWAEHFMGKMDCF